MKSLDILKCKNTVNTKSEGGMPKRKNFSGKKITPNP